MSFSFKESKSASAFSFPLRYTEVLLYAALYTGEISYRLPTLCTVRFQEPSFFFSHVSFSTSKQKELSLTSPRRIFSSNSSPKAVFGASNRYFNPFSSTVRTKEPSPYLLRASIPLFSLWFINANTSLWAMTPSRAPLSMTSSNERPSDATPKRRAYPSTVRFSSHSPVNCT